MTNNTKVVVCLHMVNLKYNYWKYKFKYSLIKDPSETSSLEYIKQQI